MHMTKSYDIYTDLYLCCMYVIYVCMMLKIHADISICICMYDLINTGTYEHSGSLMFLNFRLHLRNLLNESRLFSYFICLQLRNRLNQKPLSGKVG